jgi:alcohol dehydrogenase (cytochrome c)
MASLFQMIPPKPVVQGARYSFGDNKIKPPEPGEAVGHVDAIDPMTGVDRWRAPLMDNPIYSSILATAGGILFTGKETGEFIALDADTGETLWQFQTGSGINAQPITYTHNGEQYVTVLSGLGGLYGVASRELVKNVPPGGSVWTFALIK